MIRRIVGSWAPSTSTWSPLFVFVAIFLALYGLLNFAELPLGWKNRVPQIGHDLGVLGLGGAWVLPVLWTQKLFEGTLGVTAIVAAVRRDVRFLVASIGGWMFVMTYFSMIDIRAADRAELLEHTSYFAAFTMLLAIVIVVLTATRFLAWLRRMEARDEGDGYTRPSHADRERAIASLPTDR